MEFSSSPVFALSTGRSGSTLVQRILNCHPDLVMWGEHFGFLNGFANVYDKMTGPDFKQYPATPGENRGPSLLLPTLSDPAAPLEWVNPWSLEEFKDQLRDFIEGYFARRLNPGIRWGFKEILYNTRPVMRLLHDLYPAARFIFIRRDPIEVTRSKVFAFVKESRWSDFALSAREAKIRQMLEEVQGHYRVYADFTNRHPENSMYVDYEVLVAEPHETTVRMLEHAGLDVARYDWSLAKQVLGNVSSKTKRDDAVVALIHEVAAKMAASSPE